jgi:hypothetical protein
MNGRGTSTYPDDSKYVGEFRDAKRNGKGTLTFPDGRKQVGQFRDGKWISDTYYGPKAPDSLRVEKGGRVKMVEMSEAEKPARRSSKGRKKK